MAGYLHGAYGQVSTAGSRVAEQSRNAFVYVGTAPVHTLQDGYLNVNKPVLVQNIAEARRYFGYSDDWANYTLCEVMHAHLETKGVGPVIFINVLDPNEHATEEQFNAKETPVNGRITISGAESIIYDTVVVPDKTLNEDYTMQYDSAKETLTITEMTKGGLGTEEITITFSRISPLDVDSEDIIGESDGEGWNTGIHAIKNVYQTTGLFPSYLLCPKYSTLPEVHDAMYENSQKINGHWDAYILADIPITDDENLEMTLDAAVTWRDEKGYNKPNETVYFPMVEGTDGKKYHLSVLAAANLQELLIGQDGIPYKTASNTAVPIVQNLYVGGSAEGKIYDDQMINEKLNKNGIASAAYVGGAWVIWGAHAADYTHSTGNHLNVSETNMMMLLYLSNDFQHRRSRDVDKPMSRNDLESIVAEERTRLDALVRSGALVYGTVAINSDELAMSDAMSGDYSFVFDISTMPLAKSLTAYVNWTDEGFMTYFTL